MANRHYHFKFNVDKDATYIQRLDAQENMQNYIRRLILSDIAADSLKDVLVYQDTDSTIISDYKRTLNSVYGQALDLHDYCKHCEHEDDPDAPECKSCPHGDQDPDEAYYIARQNFYASHCPAIGDREASCKGCLYFKPEEYGGSCDIEEEFKYEWIRTREASVYGKAVTDGET